eukprot:TRINITY_DN23228_c0_g1_i2.p2 TRINITY_DN23228_c0_g1~~TRINITY_DN23228_c0_g1_i2.p2  ORF type:complete len:121 (-),score=13.52 TRINITY_DN23228_c0_g1_i2:283-645(-)
MGRYRINRELEIWSGFAMKLGSKLDRHRDAKVRENMQHEMQQVLSHFMKEFDRLENFPAILTEEEKVQIKMVQASAWYCSVYHPKYRGVGYQQEQGFAWIPYKYLIQIKRLKSRQDRSDG